MGTDFVGIIEVNVLRDEGEQWMEAVSEYGMPVSRPHADIEYLTGGRGWPAGVSFTDPLRDPSWTTLEEIEDAIAELDTTDDYYESWLHRIVGTMTQIRKNAGVKSRHVRVVWGLS